VLVFMIFFQVCWVGECLSKEWSGWCVQEERFADVVCALLCVFHPLSQWRFHESQQQEQRVWICLNYIKLSVSLAELLYALYAVILHLVSVIFVTWYTCNRYTWLINNWEWQQND